jgi:hypothetical protein
VTAALDDIKLAYVEATNPLLSRSVVEVVQSLPRNLRTNKVLFREIVAEMFPTVPFASRMAIQPLRDIVRLPAFAALLRDELETAEHTSALPTPLLRLLREVSHQPQLGQTLRWRLKRELRRHLPSKAAIVPHLLRTHDVLDLRHVAVRVLLTLRMARLFEEDATLGRRGRVRAGI